jgi:hypothetical protein
LLEAVGRLVNHIYEVYSDIIKVFKIKNYYNEYGIPSLKTIYASGRETEVNIGTKQQLVDARSIFDFVDVGNNKFVRGTNNYNFFMRHSVRAEQFTFMQLKSPNNKFKKYRKVFTEKYINLNELEESTIYNMFYPTIITWDIEPVLNRLGFILACAEGLKMKKCNVHFDIIRSSPYIRCIQTAIMVALALGNKIIHIDKKLGEFGHEPMGKINFYNNYPNRGDEIIYNGITIISDGIKENEKSHQQETVDKYSLFTNLPKEREKNILYIGHNDLMINIENINIPNIAFNPSYAYVFGEYNGSNRSNKKYYSSRFLGNFNFNF